MTNKKRRCLKAVIYLYVPDKEDLEDKGCMKYFLGRHPGRIQLYDDKGNKIGGKMKAFDTLGKMTEILTKQWRKMWLERFK